MTKITLTDLVNLQNETTAVNAINTNNAILETASDNTLSRDGTSPNTMLAAIDMNSNQIYNLPAPSTISSPARLIDVTSNPTIVVPGTGTSGHVVPFLDGNNTWSGTNAFGTVTTSNLVSPVITGHATIEGQVLTGVTGTGNLVLKTSPTITTPAISLSTGSQQSTVVTSANTGFNNLLQVVNTGTLSNASTSATVGSSLNSNAAAYIQVNGGANPAAVLQTNAGVTGGFNINSGSGPLTITSPVLTTPVLGVATGTSLVASGKITSTSPTAGIGYATGAGGTVTQLTSKITAVTLNTITGQITMNGAALASAGVASFTLNSTAIAAGDMVVAQHISGGTIGAYYVFCTAATANAVAFNVRNLTGGSLSEAIVLQYIVVKAVTS